MWTYVTTKMNHNLILNSDINMEIKIRNPKYANNLSLKSEIECINEIKYSEYRMYRYYVKGLKVTFKIEI